jgi:hypothetical protein
VLGRVGIAPYILILSARRRQTFEPNFLYCLREESTHLVEDWVGTLSGLDVERKKLISLLPRIKPKIIGSLTCTPLNNNNSLPVSIGDEFSHPYITTDKIIVVRFEVFTPLTMKNGVFWDVTLCGSCRNRRFGGT